VTAAAAAAAPAAALQQHMVWQAMLQVPAAERSQQLQQLVQHPPVLLLSLRLLALVATQRCWIGNILQQGLLAPLEQQ
jgi:hypothetical protein